MKWLFYIYYPLHLSINRWIRLFDKYRADENVNRGGKISNMGIKITETRLLDGVEIRQYVTQ